MGEQDGASSYFAMEYVEGGSLAQKLAAGPIPEPREAAALSSRRWPERSLLAHRRGIVHRDLKPANVLLTPEGVPKICDFGLKPKRLNGPEVPGQTSTVSVVGTLYYMAPEQALAAPGAIGPVRDRRVLSPSALLYELLTGRPPFKGSSTTETLGQGAPRPLDPSRPHSPRALSRG